MSAVNNNLLLTADAGVSQYQISRSLRFNSADSAYLNRTPTVAGNRKTWTWAGWVKRSALGGDQMIFSTGPSVGGVIFFRNDAFYCSSLSVDYLATSAVYRDLSAWYHFVVLFDSTQATVSQRLRFFVNGSEVTQFSVDNRSANIAQNSDSGFNLNQTHVFGRFTGDNSRYFPGYLADVHFIDGQALTPSSFTETNATTGQLVPKAYSGTYGTNGFRLNFSNNSAATLYTLGADSRTDGALNGNNGTLVNGPTYSSANGGSIVFDGTNDYVDLTQTIQFNTEDFSISGWFNSNSGHTSAKQIWNSGYDGNNPDVEIGISSTTNTLYFFVRPSGVLISTSYSVDDNTWRHFTVVKTASLISLYVNGAFVVSSAGTFTSDVDIAGVTPRIGNGLFNINNRYFKGNIAQISAYTKALSASEITQNYNALVGRFGGTSSGSIVTDGMVLNLDAGNTASYPGTGTTWTDISLRKNNWTPNNFSVAGTVLNGNNATLVNGPTYSSANGGSIVFDGVDDYVTVPIAKPASMPITFEFWINSTTATPIGLFDSAPGQPYVLRNFWVGQLDWWDGAPYVSMGLTANTWYHIVAVFRFDTYRTIDYYRNGVWISTTVATGGYSTNPAFAWTTFRLGNINGSSSYAYSGKIAKFAIYKKALSAVEVLQNYNALVGRFGGTSSGGIVTDNLILNLDAGNPASYPGTGTTWTDISTRPGDPGIDSQTDTPTSYGTDSSGTGGVVRGNYATLNPLDNGGVALSNGNLDIITGGTNDRIVRSTIGVSNGKWYWEVTGLAVSGLQRIQIGIASFSSAINTFLGNTPTSYGYLSQNGNKWNNGSGVAYGSGYSSGDLIGIAFDADNGTLTYYKNNVSQGTAFTGLTAGPYFPAFAPADGGSVAVNFGQRPFVYAAPSGFKALCDTNLPAPTIAKGSSVFDTKLYTGNNGTQSITGLEFSPDLVWVKARSSAYSNVLHDVIRGTGTDKHLYSNSTAAEGIEPMYNNFVSFDSNGFTLGPTSSINGMNASGNTFVAWAWDAGSSTVTNTAGTITSQVRANSSAGFSVITYTGNGTSNATVGHSLSVAPRFIIVKARSATQPWIVLTTAIDGSQDYAFLNTTDAFANDVVSATPTSTVFTISSGPAVNGSGTTFVAYCFAPVTGYSAFGSYTGNGSADGPFVYLGFRPKWVLVKRSNAASAQGWYLWDAARSPSNSMTAQLFPNLPAAEITGTAGSDIDGLSNGFKLRGTWQDYNASGGTYVYACFAENPFQFARAR